MPAFDVSICYRIIAEHSNRCVERTIEFGVLQIGNSENGNPNQLWRIRNHNDSSMIVACDSDWRLTHHGFYSGPISLSIGYREPTQGQMWKIIPKTGRPEHYHILTGRQVLSFRNQMGSSCLDVARSAMNHQHLLEWHLHQGPNQSFRIIGA
jgi:hypothetical protein